MSAVVRVSQRQKFVPICDQAGHLLFKYDPERGLIEIQRRGVKTLVDLTEYQPGQGLSEKKES